jgi:hypothetical protein
MTVAVTGKEARAVEGSSRKPGRTKNEGGYYDGNV